LIGRELSCSERQLADRPRMQLHTNTYNLQYMRLATGRDVSSLLHARRRRPNDIFAYFSLSIVSRSDAWRL